MTPLSVVADESTAARALAVLATLPESFAAAPGATGDVHVVDGSGTDWPDRVAHALRSGARGVLVTEPAFASPDAIRALVAPVAARGVPVLAVEPWAGHPTVAAFRGFAAGSAPAVLVQCDAVVRPGAGRAGALLAQVRFLRAALGGSPRLGAAALVPSGHLIAGRLLRGGVEEPLVLGCVEARGVRAGTRLRALTPDGELALEVGDGVLARPAVALVGGADTELHLPSIHHSAERAAWLRLRDAVRSGAPDGVDLGVMAEDAELTAGVLRAG